MGEATALERARLTIRGVRGELEIEDGRITLSKDSSPPTSLSFTVDQVRGTVIEPGSRGGRGWIHVAIVGGTLAPPGELAAMSDPYTLPLTPRSAVTARRLARIVEKHLRERGLPPEPAFAASASESGRFSTGVALTRAPVAALPRAPGAARGVPGDGGASSEWSIAPVSVVAVSNRDSEDEHPRAMRTAVAEAAVDQRVAVAGAADRWVKPSGPVVVEPPPVPLRPALTDKSERSVGGNGDHPAPGGGATRSSEPTEPPPLGPPVPTVVRGHELAAELRQLGELHTSGILTDLEFEQAKARVIS